MFEWVLQGTLTCLLILTIVWCAIVSSRLTKLQGDNRAMSELIDGLNIATERAERTISDMRNATLNAEQRARTQAAMVARQAQDLRQLLSRSSQVAIKLESVNRAKERDQRATPTLSLKSGDRLRGEGKRQDTQRDLRNNTATHRSTPRTKVMAVHERG